MFIAEQVQVIQDHSDKRGKMTWEEKYESFMAYRTLTYGACGQMTHILLQKFALYFAILDFELSTRQFLLYLARSFQCLTPNETSRSRPRGNALESKNLHLELEKPRVQSEYFLLMA